MDGVSFSFNICCHRSLYGEDSLVYSERRKLELFCPLSLKVYSLDISTWSMYTDIDIMECLRYLKDNFYLLAKWTPFRLYKNVDFTFQSIFRSTEITNGRSREFSRSLYLYR